MASRYFFSVCNFLWRRGKVSSFWQHFKEVSRQTVSKDKRFWRWAERPHLHFFYEKKKVGGEGSDRKQSGCYFLSRTSTDWTVKTGVGKEEGPFQKSGMGRKERKRREKKR